MAAGAAAAAAAAQTVEEELPFACLICRNPFTDPIVTRCGHYFDSKCAIKRWVGVRVCVCGVSEGSSCHGHSWSSCALHTMARSEHPR